MCVLFCVMMLLSFRSFSPLCVSLALCTQISDSSCPGWPPARQAVFTHGPFVYGPQEVNQKLYDNFTKRGYTGSDIDTVTNSAGKSLREAVKDAVHAHRKDATSNKLGAGKYIELREQFPRASKCEMPSCSDDMLVRPVLARYFRSCKNNVMRARPELVSFLETKPAGINLKEMNAICEIFMRCNSRNQAQIADLKGFCTFFGDQDVRAKWPQHHVLIRDQIDSVLTQVPFDKWCV